MIVIAHMVLRATKYRGWVKDVSRATLPYIDHNGNVETIQVVYLNPGALYQEFWMDNQIQRDVVDGHKNILG